MRRADLISAGCALIALGFLTLPQAANGQTTPVFVRDFVPPDEGAAGIQSVKPSIAQIGDDVSLEIENLAGWLEKLKTDKVITSGESGEALAVEQLPNLRLFIGEHLMRTLQPTEYLKDDPTWWGSDPKRAKAAVGKSWLVFNLKRDPVDPKSKADWDEVLRTSGFSPNMPLAVGVYNGTSNTAHVMAVVPGEGTNLSLQFRFQRITWDTWTICGLILLGIAVVVFFYLSIHSGMVRDTTCPVREDGLPPFSLGRCQMAFWFFLVVAAFYFIWVITGRGDTNTINGTILTLIGISAGTALGSAIVSKSQAETSAATSGPPAPPVVIYPEAIKAAGAALAQAKADREKIASADAGALALSDAAIQTKTKEVARLKAELLRWRRSNWNQLLLDLLSEENTSAGQGRVIAFHRFQIVVWTLVLGVVFVSEVLTKLAMPAFDSTLLVLMGISSGTYLGFRVSAK